MEHSDNFRGGRGGRGYGRGGKGGRRGRGGGRGGSGRGGRSSFVSQQRRHEQQGYTEDYVSPQLYPLQEQPNGVMYPSQQGYPQQYQVLQDRYQQSQLPHQQGYIHEPQRGYTTGISQSMENYETPSVLPMYQQQYQQVPPPSLQYQQPPLPQYYQPPSLQNQQYHQQQHYQDSNSRYVVNPPMPMIPAPPLDYGEAARARQQAYVPVETILEPQQTFYQEPGQAPPPSYEQQQQQQPPLPPVPQYARGDWNHPPQWQQPPPQQLQSVGNPPVYVEQGLPHQYQRDQNPRFQDRWQDRHDRQHHKQQGTPPSTYVCHNCNQPGHWKQHCPLFAGEEDSIQQRYGSGKEPDQQWAVDAGAKPQDPRRYGGSRSNVPPNIVANNEPRGQPFVPNGLTPPFPPAPLPCGNDAYAQPLPPQPDQQVWKCEPCAKSFVAVSQYNAHVDTHVKCYDCEFSACKRVVGAHYETSHGQYSGEGMKEIDVEGQKFMVLVGNSAEDIVKWREERRKKWFAMSRQPKPSVVTARVMEKRKLSISSDEDLEEGEIEEDEEAKAQIVISNATTNIEASDSAALHHGRCSVQGPPVKKPRKTMLCKWFSRGRCRFSAATCKFSHDRSTFGCRTMMHKGSCSKGMHCPFSHDTAVLSEKRDRLQKASKERATEQQWLGEKKSLLRKLLAKDVHVEQQQMLQIVHYLVENKFLRSTECEEAVMSAKGPAVKIEVLKSDEMSSNVHTEASEFIKPASKDVLMEEASDLITSEQVSTKEADSVAPYQGEELTKVVADDNVSPVVEASAYEQKLPVSEKQDDIVPSQDSQQNESVKYASPRDSEP